MRKFNFEKSFKILSLSLVLLSSSISAKVFPEKVNNPDPDSASILFLMANDFIFDSISAPEIELVKPEVLPSFATEVYIKRLDSIEREIPLPHNQYVQGYIEMYANRKREMMSRMLGLSDYYFPLFEKTLEEQGLPTEFKYLAIVESALNPLAVSRVGATGLWQFMYATGKQYKLNVDTYVDERRDPAKATYAATQYFKDMYAIYGDWLLVIASYNCGAGNVNKAIRKSGGAMDFWAIRKYLPEETRGYVPAFIAATYVMNHAREHNIFPVYPSFNTNNDTVMLVNPVSFSHLSAMLGVDMEELKALNPVYKKQFVNASQFVAKSVTLPIEKKLLFASIRDSIYSTAPFGNQMRVVLASERENETETRIINKTITYKVKKGESLSIIARKYNVDVQDLKVWNKLKSTKLVIGQPLKINTTSKIKVFVEESEPVAKVETAQQTIARQYKFYKVRKGDSLWSIADKHKGLTVEKLKSMNKIKTNNGLKAGALIKVGFKG